MPIARPLFQSRVSIPLAVLPDTRATIRQDRWNSFYAKEKSMKGGPVRVGCKRDFDHPAQYSIRVFGCLDDSWSGWFDDMDIQEESEEVTLLRGEIADQAALYGILTRVRDLGMPLLSIERLSDWKSVDEIPH